MGKFAIQTEELSRVFGAVCAVDRINLAVPAGGAFGLLGPAGAGKTTVIRLLLGLIEPTSGSAEVLGYDVRHQADQVRLRSGAVFADAGLYDRLSVAENLDYYGRIWHLNATERRDRQRELLGRLDLWDERDAPVAQVSALQRRRLSVARALIHRPQLLCVDEPTEGLDAAAADLLRADLNSLIVYEGVTALLAIQNPAEADALCGSVAFMRSGRVVAAGPVAALRSRSTAPTLEVIGRGFTEHLIALLSRRPEVAAVHRIDNRLMLELAGEYDTAPLVSLLVEASADVEEVRKHAASMEAVYAAVVQGEIQP